MDNYKIFDKLKQGKLLKHKQDFCLIPSGHLWKRFNDTFKWSMVFRYIPSKDNKIDYYQINLLIEKHRSSSPKRKRDQTPDGGINTQGLRSKQLKSFNQPRQGESSQNDFLTGSRYKKANNDEPPVMGQKPNKKGPKFLNMEIDEANVIKTPHRSIMNTSQNASTYEPEFLDQNRFIYGYIFSLTNLVDLEILNKIVMIMTKETKSYMYQLTGDIETNQVRGMSRSLLTSHHVKKVLKTEIMACLMVDMT